MRHLLKWVSSIRYSGMTGKSIGTVSFFLSSCPLNYCSSTNSFYEISVCMCMHVHVHVYVCTSLRILFINSLITIQVHWNSAWLRSSLSFSLFDWVEVWKWSIDQLPGDRSYWLWLIQLFIFEPLGLTSIDRHTPRSRQGVQPCLRLMGLNGCAALCVLRVSEHPSFFFFFPSDLIK